MKTYIKILIALAILLPISSLNASESKNIAKEIRIKRLESCENAYKESWIKDKFIYKQLMVVRCATYSTLIYAYESNFWQSEKCIKMKNCYGMKWNWYEHKAWFITFDTYEEWRNWFSYKYFQWHYKKKINTFVNNWSETQQEEYKSFMWNNYTKIYKELEILYLTNR